MNEEKLRALLQIQPEKVLALVFAEQRQSIRRMVSHRLDRRLRGRIDPSDIVQDTLAEAFQRLGEYLTHPKYSLKSWLYSLANQQVALTHRRHVTTQKRSVNREQTEADAAEEIVRVSDVASDSTDPGTRVAKSERAENLHQALLHLSERLRVVVQMRFIEDRSIAEISDALGISKEAASKRVARGLVRLSELLDERYR